MSQDSSTSNLTSKYRVRKGEFYGDPNISKKADIEGWVVIDLCRNSYDLLSFSRAQVLIQGEAKASYQ